MSMQFSRNVVVPIWFAVFALVAIFAPPFQFFPPVFLLILGLVVPTLAYMLWHDPPVPVSLVPKKIVVTGKSPLTQSAYDAAHD